MMKKADAGVAWFVLGVFLMGVCWTGGGGTAFGQESAATGTESAPVVEAVAPAEDAPAAAVEEAAVPVPDFKAKVAVRIEELRSRPVADIEAAVAACEEAMKKLHDEARAARLATRELQEKMRAENPDVRAKYREIDELRQKINAFIDELPEVKEKLDSENAAQALLMEEVWFRTAALGLLAEKDRAAGFPAPVSNPPAAAEVAPAATE